jgi:hypothetical protein
LNPGGTVAVVVCAFTLRALSVNAQSSTTRVGVRMGYDNGNVTSNGVTVLKILIVGPIWK